MMTGQRDGPQRTEGSAVTALVRGALASPGQPLDESTRAFMEPRLGHDFSHVRVHSEASSAESARAVNALAYTVGRDIVFGAGQYAPETDRGMRMLAHELSHVVQQRSAPLEGTPALGEMSLSDPSDQFEREANSVADRVMSGAHQAYSLPTLVRLRSTPSQMATRPPVQRQSPKPAPLDATAEKIVARAANPKRDLKLRGVELIYDILNQYFPGYASKVAGVGFDDDKAEPALGTDSKWSPGTKTYYGHIWVGTTYLQSLINDKFTFAHHVLQVQHELEHIDQYRSGLGGKQNKDEREFLAHAHEAVAVEKAGTGEMQHSTRMRYIDAAVGVFFCLDKALWAKNDPISNKTYEKLKDELLARRPSEAKYVKSPSPPPSKCTPLP